MSKTNPNENEQLNLNFLGVFGRSANGRYSITCLVIITVLFMCGLAYGFW
ncbi:hypothetical protein SJ05684_c25060 [Sinorhizobium sojae CCBAU 05684]|uniref:Uncharacterized protein n=1 Tax=Sinorhizobium sojae CCBAU 05684 TaxID=716928 RepID=A0A249PDV2_9HYPH|nr:hypothetical protein SJ05684_c25060 [Sinorhizobium sojae CCBAU 05684]